MPENISSSMYTQEMGNLDVNRLKAFIKGIVVAQNKIKEKEMAREELKEHISTVKKLAAAKKPSVEKLKRYVNEIEDKVNTVLQKEAKLLRTSAYESKTITELRKKVVQLEQELSTKETQNKNLAKINDESIKKLTTTIDSMQQNIKKYISDKTERERKMKELEEKIRGKVELGDVREKIEMLEARYNELAQKGEHEGKDLERIRQRIDSLKLQM